MTFNQEMSEKKASSLEWQNSIVLDTTDSGHLLDSP